MALRISRIHHHSIGHYSARRHSLGLFEGPQWAMMDAVGTIIMENQMCGRENQARHKEMAKK